MGKKWLIGHKTVNLLAHLSAWGVFMSLPLLVRHGKLASPHVREEFDQVPLLAVMGFSVVMIGVFYLNFFILVPKILNKRGIRYYLPTVAMIWSVWAMLNWAVQKAITPHLDHLSILASIFPFLLVTALSLSIRLLIDKSRADREVGERENENLKSELAFLRSQISPHFLFNVMNNTVALSRVRPELVEPTLIKLSDLMRYMLYNSDEKQVSLAREAAYLAAYIDLQQLRFGDSVVVNFQKNLPDTGGGNIEPMLLIPFVENAFKHGTGMIDAPIIDIKLEVNCGKKIIFQVKNKINQALNEKKDPDSGIGLRNVSRRLELLYGDRHRLDIDTGGGYFSVKLTIK